jgi:predicted RNA-binding Zn-ribbon protein involved in translation (DUF1610 family)
MKNFDERDEEIITCEHCGVECPVWEIDDHAECPNCGEVIQ